MSTQHIVPVVPVSIDDLDAAMHEEDDATQQFRKDLSPAIKFLTVFAIVQIVTAFASKNHFSVNKETGNLKHGSFSVTCSRAGKKKSTAKESNVKRQARTTIKCGCEWRIFCKKNPDDTFSVARMHLKHTNGCSPCEETQRSTAKARGHSFPLHIIDDAVPFSSCTPTQRRQKNLVFLCLSEILSIL